MLLGGSSIIFSGGGNKVLSRVDAPLWRRARVFLLRSVYVFVLCYRAVMLTFGGTP